MRSLKKNITGSDFDYSVNKPKESSYGKNSKMAG
jgi:hypothetical protein